MHVAKPFVACLTIPQVPGHALLCLWHKNAACLIHHGAQKLGEPSDC